MTRQTTPLENLLAVGLMVGITGDIEQHPAGFDCPTHHEPLVDHMLYSIDGWKAVTVCPSFVEGSCRYTPFGDPRSVEPPAGAVS